MNAGGASKIGWLGALGALGLALIAACTSGSGVETRDMTGAATIGSASVPIVDAGPAADAFVSQGPYPAAHPAPAQVLSLGGPVLTAPRYVPVFWPNDVDETYVRAFLDDYVASDIYTQQTGEYGVGTATVTASCHPTDEQPAALRDEAIRAWLTNQFEAALAAQSGSGPGGVLPLPDANTVYLLYFPSGTNLAAGDGLSDVGCQDFLGYHESVNWRGEDVSYAVFPRCPQYTGLQLEEELTAASNHEMVEAATDPYPSAAPAFDQVDPLHDYYYFEVGGSEVADMCQNLVGSFGIPAGFPYNVQRTWSNASTLAGHEPCIPAPPGPYFASVPVLPDMVTYTDEYGSVLTTAGVHIPVGGVATIDLDLFSDQPTDGQWTIVPRDDTSVQGASQTLGFRFDNDVNTGSNGDVLRMTITVVQAPFNHVEGFWVFSELNGRVTAWLGVVTND